MKIVINQWEYVIAGLTRNRSTKCELNEVNPLNLTRLRVKPAMTASVTRVKPAMTALFICALLVMFCGNVFSNTPRWTADDSRFTNSMTITAIVVNGGAELRSEQVEIGAFSGAECRGSAFLQFVPALDQYMGFMMIFGEGGETITLKVFDHDADAEYYVGNEPLLFASDVMHGNPNEPYVIISNAFPEPLRTLVVTNGSGSGVFAEGSVVSIVAGAPPAGQQFDAWDIIPSVVFVSGTGAISSSAQFVMPASSVLAIATYKQIITATPQWTAVDGRYTNTMTLSAIVMKGSAELRSAQLEIGAFSGDECRGAAVLQYIPEIDRFFGFLMIYGEGGESVTLKVYDHATSIEETVLNAPLTFVADVIHGSPIAPFIINLEPDPAPVWEVTVTNGSGSGEYAEGDIVVIVANDPPEGQQFAGWEITPSVDFVFGNETTSSAEFVMPATEVSIIAAYEDIPPGYHLITVTTEGYGLANADVVSAPQDTEITLTAIAYSGYCFVEWVVETGRAPSLQAIANPATFIMPDEAVEIKAIFEFIQPTKYVVTISSVGTGATGDDEYFAGSMVAISAGTPPSGQQFKNWTTESAGVFFADANSATTVFTMPTNDVAITANFETIPPGSHSITVSIEGNGSASANLPSAPQGAVVTITATAHSGYRFVEWVVETGRAPSLQIQPNETENPATFTMPDEAVEIKAIFEEIPPITYSVTVSSIGTNAFGDGEFVAGSIVSISAGIPQAGRQFKNWTTESAGVFFADANSATTVFTMPTNDVTITANFETIPPGSHSITVSVEGDGSASANVASAPQDAVVTITATAHSGYRFVEWVVETGRAPSLQASVNPATFTMPDEAVEIKAIFEEIQPTTFNVTVSSVGTDAVGDGDYTAGTLINISAGMPPEGQRFKNWIAEDSNVIFADANSIITVFVMPANDVTVRAIFEDIPPTYMITFSVVGDNGTITATVDGTVITNGKMIDEGKDVVFTAFPGRGYQVKEWTINGIADDNNTSSVFILSDLADDTAITVVFEVVFNGHVIVVSTDGNGSALSNASSAVAGVEIMLIATAHSGYRFVEWQVINGDVVLDDETANPTAFEMPDEAVEIMAIFEIDVEGNEIPTSLNFDTYVVTKWNNNTFMLDLNRLYSEGYMVTACRWYKNGAELISNDYTYSAGSRSTDRIVAGVYHFVLTTSNRGTLRSSDKIIDGQYISASGLKAYPNPLFSGSVLTIENVAEGSMIEVYNQSGLRVIHTVANGSPATLSLDTLPAGVYVVRTANGEVKIVIFSR